MRHPRPRKIRFGFPPSAGPSRLKAKLQTAADRFRQNVQTSVTSLFVGWFQRVKRLGWFTRMGARAAAMGPGADDPPAPASSKNALPSFLAGRPLALVALLYASGVLGAHVIELPLVWLFVVAFTASLTALFFAPPRPWLLWSLFPLLGCINLTSRTLVLAPHDLRTLIGEATELLSVRGTLCETPTQRVFERDHELNSRSIAQVEVRDIRRTEGWQPAFGRVAVSTPGVLDKGFFAGQFVEITGVMRLPKSPIAEGLFDYRAYLRALGIYYQLAVESTNDWRTIAVGGLRPSQPWSDRFLVWAQSNLAKGLGKEDEALRLLWAMTLGWKTGLTQEVSEPFMRSGTLHIFAISGLHIALIAGILVSVLRVLRLPRAACGLIAIPLIWFYTAATGWQASAIRSAIMMNVIIGGWALKRPSDLINSLAASGLIILVWDPRQLFQAGFQLSFFVVLSIGLLLPPLEKMRQRVLRTDPLLPPELRPRWQRLLDRPLHHLTTSLATSLAAWLGSLPLIAYYFYLVTPVSLLANMIIVPLSSLALMASLGSLLCGGWLPGFTELFNHSGWFWMRAMVWASHWTANLPGAYFYVRPPSLLQFVIYYLVLGACWSGWLLARQRRRWVLLGAVGLLAAWTVHSKIEGRTIRLAILPLGGSGLYFDAPGRANDLLIDCGNRASAEFVVRPFLRSQGVKRLGQVLLTHGDINHVGGWDSLREQFSVSQVFTSSVRFRSPAYRQIIAGLENSPGRWRKLRRGDSVSGWTVLHPGVEDHFAQADDNAIVLFGEFYGVRILLLSDLGRLGQRTLLERTKELRADIIVTGLPTHDEPVLPALIETVQPRLIVVASAEFPSTAKAGRKLRERLARTPLPVIYTSDTGTATLVMRPNRCEVRTVKEGVIPFDLQCRIPIRSDRGLSSQ